MKRSNADIIQEHGPFPGVEGVHGLTYDGDSIWFASKCGLTALDPESSAIRRTLEIAADAGTAYDGRHLFQLGDGHIQKVDPETGSVLGTIPAPEGGASGMAWAEGTLWVGQYRDHRIHQLDPQSGAILRTIESDRFVTGVTWLDGALWHGCGDGDNWAIRRIDGATGDVLESLDLPSGTMVSGLESDGVDRFFCGGGGSGKVRVVRRPGAAS